MINCVILGPTNIKKIKQFGRIDNIKQYIGEACDFFVKNFDEILIVPDRGLPLSVARVFKKKKSTGRVIGYIPDKTLGGANLQRYYHYCDEIRGIGGGWYNLNTELTRKSDHVFCLGFSAGVLIELCSIKYNQKYLNLETEIFIDRRCISKKLPQEISLDLKNLYYFNNFNQIQKFFNHD